MNYNKILNNVTLYLIMRLDEKNDKYECCLLWSF